MSKKPRNQKDSDVVLDAFKKGKKVRDEETISHNIVRRSAVTAQPVIIKVKLAQAKHNPVAGAAKKGQPHRKAAARLSARTDDWAKISDKRNGGMHCPGSMKVYG